MNNSANGSPKLPPEQQAIRDKCFHPSGTFVEFPIEDVETSIPARFEKIVRAHPDRIAVKVNNDSITYRDLNAIANRIACKAKAVTSDKSGPIALLLDNSMEQIAAMLGVLKAGRCFVPLNPAHPRAQLASVYESCQPAFVIVAPCHHALGESLERDSQRICNLASLDGSESGAVQEEISAQADAFIVFTSGSTGRPKGILWRHSTLLHHVMLRTRLDKLCPMDRVTQLTMGAANAITDLFSALLNGSTLLAYNAAASNTEGLFAWLQRERVTVCIIAAPLFRRLCEILPQGPVLPDLRLIRLRSDAVLPGDVTLFKQHFAPGCALENGLATTETGVLAVYFISHETILAGAEVPVGYPVDDKDILLLDDDDQRVGPNAVGEIVVRSRYLASGYWRQPELTAAQFKIDGEDPEKFLYYTGDLGLMRPDGSLIHKGRKDFRVKIRGHGVDLLEVEQVLRGHSDIVDAIAVGRVSDSGETRLVGYFTTACEPGPSASELRTFMRGKLADYSIPAAFVKLKTMPLSDNGKIDRRALPAPATVRPALNVPYVPPSSVAERRLAKIWFEMLGLDQIGVHDSFFDLGGDSLSAMRVTARIRDLFQLEVPLLVFFETPTIGALVSRFHSCAPVQSAAHIDPPKLGERVPPLPLSFGQERLWFLEQLEPHACRHNLVVTFSLRGTLDTAALERAFNEIIKRHESLRTVFHGIDGKPFQMVLDELRITIATADIVSPSKEAAEAALRQVCATEGRRPFDLSAAPLLRPTIVKADGEPIALVIVLHHLIFDGWSMDVFVRELSAHYTAAVTGQPCQFSPLPIQYADFAIWQRERLESRHVDDDLAFWRKQLAELPDLRLPVDRSRPGSRDGRGTRRWFALSPTVTLALKEIAREAGATLFMTLLAGYQTLLSRYSGQDDICVGVPVAGRQDAALDDAIGFFLNMLVLRGDLSGNPTFRELLARMRECCLEAYAHQDLPFEKLVDAIQPKRALNQNPLFQASLTLRSRSGNTLSLAGLEVEEVEIDPGLCRFDLELYIEEKDPGLHGFIIGAADLFDSATIERMVGHYQTLLEGIVANPDQGIAELPLLTAGEQHRLLVEWNETQREYPRDTCLHRLFEEQTGKTPSAVALVYEDQQLTYGELNSRANQLAQYLQKHGAGPEVLVGVCLERSIEMIVALLGILKAGGAYVPIDPSYPPERLRFLLDDAGCNILLTQKNWIEEARWKVEDSNLQSLRLRSGQASMLDPRLQIICFDRDWSAIEKESHENPDSEVTPENLAYVIYTSGSTGVPKGVMVPHRAVVNHMLWMQEAFGFSQDDGVVQKTPITFDASVWEVFAPLMAGARLIVARPEGHRDSGYLARLIQERSATVLQVVPSQLGMLLEESEFLGCEGLRLVFSGGEVLATHLAQQFFARGPKNAQLINLYGPTEAAIDATHWACQRDSEHALPPIGRPIANVRIYVLDASRNPVPIGVVGEVYIGGAGLARGYLNRPEITAEKFITLSFDGVPVQRLYRTGDLARYLPDGAIEFRGRIDDQVKLRGYRIEPGEIESVLARHVAVRRAFVLAREDITGDKYLIAYVVPSGAAIDPSDLRSYLKSKLPDYLVPSRIVPLDALPLTPNGKVDRRALPDPGWHADQEGAAFVAPRNATEEIIAAVWSEVLGNQSIGVRANFFDIGGHSLKATQVISRLRAKFFADIPLRHMFEYPTIAKFAAAIGPRQDPSPPGVDTLLNEIEALTEEEAQKLVGKN